MRKETDAIHEEGEQQPPPEHGNTHHCSSRGGTSAGENNNGLNIASLHEENGVQGIINRIMLQRNKENLGL